MYFRDMVVVVVVGLGEGMRTNVWKRAGKTMVESVTPCALYLYAFYLALHNQIATPVCQ